MLNSKSRLERERERESEIILKIDESLDITVLSLLFDVSKGTVFSVCEYSRLIALIKTVFRFQFSKLMLQYTFE